MSGNSPISYEMLIAAAGSVVIEPLGISMLPFLKEGRDSVRLVSPAAAPQNMILCSIAWAASMCYIELSALTAIII